jgi:hypothetical protein
VLASPALAQRPPGADTLIAQQRAAMAKLSFMDGVWRGPASTLLPSGEKHTVTQTERIGPFLDGAVKVIEGRGYDAKDNVTFNAFGIVSYDPAKKAHAMRSYTMGRAGDFALTPSDSGFVWEIPAGLDDDPLHGGDPRWEVARDRPARGSRRRTGAVLRDEPGPRGRLQLARRRRDPAALTPSRPLLAQTIVSAATHR